MSIIFLWTDTSTDKAFQNKMSWSYRAYIIHGDIFFPKSTVTTLKNLPKYEKIVFFHFGWLERMYKSCYCPPETLPGRFSKFEKKMFFGI